jgi:iron complex transport system ATP-binding protein
MYEASGLSFTIGGRRLLDAVDLRLSPGRIVGLIGPNGAGKSTLLKIMAGEHRASAGSVRLFDREIRDYAPAELARLRSVLAQSVTIAFPFDVDEVVRLGLPPASPRSRADHLVAKALAAVGLVEEAGRQCPSLSGGEQQRVHLARVLVQLWAAADDGRARYLLLDEPTSSLDLSHQLLVMRVARAHAEAGGGVLAVMHDLNLAAMTADELIALHRGRVVARGTPAEVITNRLMRDVYGIDLKVCVPPRGVFVLPQTASDGP